MPVRARLGRYKDSLLAKNPLPVPSARRTWSWSAGSAVDELALHEAQRYLANDWDVEALFLNVARYDALGDRASSGMWETTDEVYDPQAVIKQGKHAKLPYVAVTVAIPGQWLDTAVKLKSGAVKTGHRLVPVARKGYKLAREQVRKHRSPQGRVSTHTAQVNLSFETKPGRGDALKEQLVKAGVLMTDGLLAAFPPEGAPAMFTASDAERQWERIKFARSKVRIAGTDGVMHLAELSMEPPKVFCGVSVWLRPTPSNKGSVWALPGEPAPSNAKLLCPDCVRIAEQVAPAPETAVSEATDAKGGTPDFEALRPTSRVLAKDGVLHLTSEPFPPTLGDVVPRCGLTLDIGPVRYFEALAKRGDPTPQGARAICPECSNVELAQDLRLAVEHVPWPESEVISQEEQMAALVDRPRLVDAEGVMHLAFVLMLDPERLQESLTRCKFELCLAKGAQRYVSCAFPDEPTPAEAVSVCLACVNGESPAAAVAQPQDPAPELPEDPAPEPATESPAEDSAAEAETCGDDPSSGWAPDGGPGGSIYLPGFLVKSGLTKSVNEGFVLINDYAVTVDGMHVSPTVWAHSLVGKMLVVEGATGTQAAMLERWGAYGRLAAREIPVVSIPPESTLVDLPALMVAAGMASTPVDALTLIKDGWLASGPGLIAEDGEGGLVSPGPPSLFIGKRIELRPGHPSSVHPESKPVVHSFVVLSV